MKGFYGKSYDFTSRHELISSMAGTDLNFYLYAPKDPFLRNNFDLAWNESWQAKFTEFISHAEDCGIDIGVGLTPFKDKHIEKFDLKVNFFANLGCKNISLLFDDLEKINLDKQLNILSKGISEFPEIHFDFAPLFTVMSLLKKTLHIMNILRNSCKISQQIAAFIGQEKKLFLLQYLKRSKIDWLVLTTAT